MQCPGPTELLAAESHRFPLQGRWRVALLYPNRYAVAMASLGYQALWARLDSLPDVAVERVVMPEEEVDTWGSLETGRRLADFDLIALSISDELDLPHLIRALEAGGLAPLREARDEQAPPILAGGPLTQSNPRPLGPFVDAVLCGDSEGLLETLLAGIGQGRAAYVEGLAGLPGLWRPTLDGDESPAPRQVAAEALPAWSRVWTPHAALADMFLVEVSRGCPRRCDFCLSRRARWPERRAALEPIWARVPPEAPRVGFVGAAVSEHPDIKTLVERAVERGQGVGLSSLRADRLDEELVGLLVRGGLRTMTVAADATSERLRESIHKGIREEHLLRAAELARAHGIRNLKIYVIVGLPEETEADLDECAALCDRLRKLGRLSVSLNPFVPKRGTPLADFPMPPLAELERRIQRLRKSLGRQRVELTGTSPRWAWVQWRLSQGGQEAGLAALAATQAGGRFADWKRALGYR